jgi:conjugative relaxase-like TrwC/TraI family protein
MDWHTDASSMPDTAGEGLGDPPVNTIEGRDGVLNVAKLGAGQERYYLDSVASGAEDYYLGNGEEPGQWTGHGSELLDLDGVVAADALGDVLEGRDPNAGVRFTQARKDRVPGFDLTFSAPKSVSVLWALTDPETSRQVRVAHDGAVDAALGWMEREACRSRRGVDGTEHLVGDGFVAAKFFHRTSRAGDPQLHTHVLVANLTRCDDGQWRTLDGHALYWQAQTGGYLYKAHLRDELTRRLGVNWEPVRKGAAEIVGIPEPLIRLFSTRRREIEDELADRDLHTPQAARVAALDTRRAKTHAVTPERLREQWATRTVDAGHDPHHVTVSLDQASQTPVDRTVAETGTDELLSPCGLTRRDTSFGYRDVLRAWCEQLPSGAPITTIERLARHTMRDARVVPLNQHGPYPAHSTRELIALERRLIGRAAESVDHGHGVAADDAIASALRARPELSGEQVAVVARLTGSGNGVDVLVAAAGTGKTFSLDAAADAWRRSGYTVIGTALAATAAAQLQTQTAILSDTIALRILQLQEGKLTLDARTVLVVDEAAMAGTRQLATLLDAAHDAHGKVVLVGDPKQLNAIDAGGLLNSLASRTEPVTLTENRRQAELWEREALSQLRVGNIDTAFDSYQQHHRVVHAPTAIDVRNQLAADWYAATLTGDDTLMVAHHNHDVDDLNRRARRHRRADGTLHGPTLTIADVDYQAGDRVVCLRNDRKLGVRNGTRATITSLEPDARTVTIRTDQHTAFTLPAKYLDAGHLRHGYALTVHKAQGLTVDRCLLLGTDSLDQQTGYTALSRGRHDNRIYLVDHHEPDPATHGRPAPSDPDEHVQAALGRDRHDRLAIDHGIDTGRLRYDLFHLINARDHLNKIVAAIPPDHTTKIRALERELDEQHQRRHDAHQRLQTVQSTRYGLRRRDRTTDLLAAERNLDNIDTGIERIQTQLERTRNDQHQHDRYQHDHHDDLARHDTLTVKISMRLDDIIDSYGTDLPRYLKPIGPYPTNDLAQVHWRNAAHHIETYRTMNRITDPDQPLGPATDHDYDRHDTHHEIARHLDLIHLYEPRPRREHTHEQTIEPDLGLEL